MATTQRTVVTNKTLCQAFLITSLLTRDPTQSESAILSAIASSDPEEISEHEFILRSAAMALTATAAGAFTRTTDNPRGIDPGRTERCVAPVAKQSSLLCVADAGGDVPRGMLSNPESRCPLRG